MKLNIDSVSARLYRWFYATFEMPQSLCPYFWKLAIMWTFIVPYSALSLPVIISDRITSEPYRKAGERFFFGLFLWVLLFLAFLILFPITYFFWGWFPKDSLLKAWQLCGILLEFIAVVVSFVFGIIYLISLARERKRQSQRQMIWDAEGNYIPNPNYRPKKPNIIIEFTKATYNRYCPKIDWNYGVYAKSEDGDNN